MVMASPSGPYDDALVPVTILVPIDGSALGERSLGQQLAVRFDAEVRTATVGVDGHEVAADLVLTANRPRRCSTILPVQATPHVLPGSDPVAGLLSLADRVAPPALLAVDSYHAGERAHHDVACQLIRGSRWPVLATLGT
jgi:hypothetical protein